MKKLSLCLIFAILFTSLVSCTKDNNQGSTEKNSVTEDIAKEDIKASPLNEENIKFIDELKDSVDIPFTPRKFTEEVKDYSISKDLSNVSNVNIFGEFSGSQKEALAEDGFFISPAPSVNDDMMGGNDLKEQIFYIYEDNEYKNIPSFVTTDSVLHMYHLFYDNFLKELEETQLYPKLIDLCQGMIKDSIEQYETITNEEVKDLALRNIGFFGTSLLLLGEELPENIPEDALRLAKEEADKIQSKSGDESNILNIPMDFSQYTVRGHYTKSETLKKYFKTVMYFGQGAFWEREGDILRDDLMGMALLITNNIFKNEENYKTWSDIYSPINFLVEGSDDLTPIDFGKLLYGIYGREPDLNELLNPKHLRALHGNIQSFTKPKIAGFKGYSFRFMPQRAVIDATWMQNLLDIAGPGKPSNRPIYSGLDLMAVLGSPLAKEIQLNDENNKKWDKYEERLEQTIKVVSEIPHQQWQKNLYRGWIWTLQELTGEFKDGYPKFMQSKAWEKKDLNTALGSWAELKHDTVLYGKQTMAEMGGGSYPEVPKSYVEPNVRVYEKLSWLIEYTKENLQGRNMLEDRLATNLDDFKDMVDKLALYSEKELRNEELTIDEYRDLEHIGGTMEMISLRFVNDDSGYWSLIDEGDRKMTIVSDLMKVPENTWDIPSDHILSTAVGPAYEIYVVYPIGDELILGRGGVFSYREFISEERLTDEKWRETVDKDEEYGIPNWMEELLKEEKNSIPYPDMDY